MHESSLILKVQHCRRSGHHALAGQKSNLEKSFQHIKPTSRYLYCRGKKNPYHIYWLRLHFPLGKPSVMRKEMEEDSFSPSALSTQLILLGGQISAVPGEGKEKMSQINQEQNDWWPVSAANNTRLLIIQLQMKAGAPRMTSIHAAGAILDVSSWLHQEMERAVFSHEAFTRSLRKSMRQTNILTMQARSSSAGTLIGWGVPVCCCWLLLWPSEPDGTAVRPNTAAAF